MLSKRVNGVVVAAHGRQYHIALACGEILRCVPRGKRSEAVCGDRVTAQRTEAGHGVLELIHPRSNLLFRADAFRSKAIAANVTQVGVVVAPIPSPSEELLNRCLLAIEAIAAQPLLIANKADLPADASWHALLQRQQNLGIPLLTISALGDVAPLRHMLQDHCTVLVGQSGMGKTSLLNALLPDVHARTAEVSLALDTGRHTTTHASYYTLDETSTLIDSPGMQTFGLSHIAPNDLAHLLPEFRPLLGTCRFHNCSHRREPECAVRAAMESGQISKQRYRLYTLLYEENTRASLNV